MALHKPEASAKAARLVAAGQSYRAAAAAAGVALSSCVAACKRLGIVSQRPPGRPGRSAKCETEHLLATPRNRARLTTALDDISATRTT